MVQDILNTATNIVSWPLIVFIAVVLIPLILVVLFRLTGSLIFIPNDSYGVVERIWATSKSSRRVGFMALEGGAGFLPEVITGGWHFFMPLKYKVHMEKLITVRSIGYVFARTGQTLPAGQALAAWPEGVDPRDARSFLLQGGQEGPQRMILRAATYAINTALFVVLTDDAKPYAISLGDGKDESKISGMRSILEDRGGFYPVVVDGDRIGVVTVQDAPGLDNGEIIAPTVGTDAKDPTLFHNSFQDIQRFLAAGGRRGRQDQVLTEGTFYINRWFATVEMKEKTSIELGTVGVVVSFTGPQGQDVSGDEFRHGKLVAVGQRGVWSSALQPGKYAYNPYAYKIQRVPTTNFQLRWIQDSTDSHNFDANLSEIRLITKDAFEPILPLSIVVHINQEDAPYVVQQFAEIGKLVDQTLDPLVSAYFKDAAQEKTLIELVTQRAQLQAQALQEMKLRFQKYRLNVMEVMIGTPRAAQGDKHIDTVFEQLRTRQVAREQAQTFASQQAAAVAQRELNEAQAIAAQQTSLTASSIAIEVAENEGQAAFRRRVREAEGTVKTAQAEAERTKLLGEAEASRIEALGRAEASATQAQAEALGGPQAALRRITVSMLAEAVQNAAQPITPHVVMGGSEKQTSIVDLLLGLAISDGKLADIVGSNDQSLLGKRSNPVKE